MAKRKAISTRTRFEIFKRDRFTCQYCGRTPPTVILEIDHIVPVANGGGDERTNLVTACWDCNSGKSDKPLSAVPKAIAADLQEQVERRKQLEAYNRFLLKSRKADDDLARDIGTYWIDKLSSEREQGKWTFGDNKLSSLKTFLKRLPAAEIYEAVDIALSRKHATRRDYEAAFKYFCGVCWSKIKQREGGDAER